MYTRRNALLRSLIPLVLLMSVAACGDDDGDATATTPSPTTTEGASAEFQEYCDAVLEIETAPEPDIDFETATPEQQTEALKTFAAETIKPITDRIKAIIPSEIESEIETQIAAVEQVAANGDASALETPEFEAAEAKTHAFDLENCGWQQSDVAMADYSFQGLEDTYEAGPVSFDVSNEGAELHELIVLRKNDDTTETFDQLLELPEEEAQAKVTEVASTFAAPGETEYVVADLEAGEYLAVCFIPVGLTPEAAEAAETSGTEPSGAPHFTEGMKAEFTVS
jgi:hypothetical protein